MVDNNWLVKSIVGNVTSVPVITMVCLMANFVISETHDHYSKLAKNNQFEELISRHDELLKQIEEIKENVFVGSGGPLESINEISRIDPDDFLKAPFDNWFYHAIGFHQSYNGYEIPVEVKASEHDSFELQQYLRRHTVKNLEIPVISEFGFKIIGGRVHFVRGHSIAHIMYEDRRGHLLSLFATSNRIVSNFIPKEVQNFGDLKSLEWTIYNNAFAVMGWIETNGDIQRIAKSVDAAQKSN